MNRLNLRSNWLTFIKTAGELPITVEEFMECASNRYRKNRRMSTWTCKHSGSQPNLMPKILPDHWFTMTQLQPNKDNPPYFFNGKFLRIKVWLLSFVYLLKDLMMTTSILDLGLPARFFCFLRQTAKSRCQSVETKVKTLPARLLPIHCKWPPSSTRIWGL